MNGVAGGFVMANHGKREPLTRMSNGDGVVIYAPKLEFGKKEPCQKFIAIGKVINDVPYQVEMIKDFHPFRLDVEYQRSEEAEIRPLIEKLNFINDKAKWGFKFRFGHFEIGKEDFIRIADAMDANM